MARAGPVLMTLRGRLGNQLFIFATGYACARRNDARLLFYDAAHLGAQEYPLFELVGPEYRLASPRELMRFGQYDYPGPLSNVLGGWSAQLAQRRAARSPRTRLIVEERLGSHFEAHRAVLEAQPPVWLTGWFQNEEYFTDYAEEIVAAIRLPAIDEAYMGSLPRPAVSVSFRRGDYVNHDYALPLAYYRRAFEYVCKEVAPASLLLFSDDPEFVELATPWAREYAPVYTPPETMRSPLHQLALLAACDHHVIANSTYSWWGAWLGESRAGESRTVIAPAGWLEGDDGLVPARWLRMPTTPL